MPYSALAACCILMTTILLPGSSHAYIGPGLGLGAGGVILGLLLSVVLAIFAIVWYPFKRLVRKFRQKLQFRNHDQP